MTELPQNWIESELIKVADLYTGNSINEKVKSEKYTNLSEGINYIATKDIGYDKRINYNNGIKIPFSERGFKVAPAKSTLLCIEGGSAGRKIGYTKEDVCFVNKLCAFVSKLSEENSRWIYYYLQSYDFKSQFFDKKNGLIGGVGVNKLKQLKIKLPPENEQKRIVKKLDAIIPKVEEVNSRLERVPLILKRARQSILNQAITGELTKDWRKKNNKQFSSKTVKLSDVCELLNGYAYKSSTYVTDSNNLVIRLGNVKNNKILLDAKPVFIPNNIATETERFKIQENDILITLTGTRYKRDYLYSALVTANDLAEYNLYLNQRVGCFRVKEGYLPQYLNILLKTQDFLDIAFELETGNVNQGNIGTTNLKDIEIDIPDIEEQTEIIRLVNTSFAKLDKIEEQYKKAKSYTDRITQSILHKAFTGNLVPQDPNDKPVELPE